MKPSRRQFLTGVASIALLSQIKQQAIANAIKDTGLKDLYGEDFLIGGMIQSDAFMRPKADYTQLISREFNAIATNNAFKWQYIHPTEEHWNWLFTDRFVGFGENQNLKLLGHLLLWHAQLPMGLFSYRPHKPVTEEKLLAKMETHIATAVDRYQGRMYSWDVVNEAIDENKGWRKTNWFKYLGEEYVGRAFNVAHEADSNAMLVYNDYNMSLPGKRNFMLDVLDDFKRKRIPIDVIGMQGHFGLDYPDLNELEKSIEAYAAKGMRIHFSELDVDVLPNIKPGTFPKYSLALDPYRNGLPKDMEEKLTQRYRDLFTLFLKHRDKIDVVAFWGVGDGNSWKNEFPLAGRKNYPLVFDRNLNKKPAYHAIAELKSHKAH